MRYTLIGLLLLLTAMTANAQFKNYPLKAGLQYSIVVPYTEFYENDGLKFDSYSRGFIRFELGGKTEAEIGGGYVKFSGLDRLRSYYCTNIYPLDFRINYSPFESEDFNPYGYIGLGVIYSHNVYEPLESSSPSNIQSKAKKNLTTGIIPVGVGFEYMFSDDIFGNMSAGYTPSFSSQLNYYQDKTSGFFNNDGFFNVGAGVTFVVNLANKDKDKDGLTNKEEEKLGTNPKNPDTDNDGLTDGDEVLKYKTNPLRIDTDGDGLSDYDEVFKYKTDPNIADTDGDGLNDGDEVLRYRTNPIIIDTDDDGLSDGDEVLKYKTDPLNTDTDSDGLSDGYEVLNYKTNPRIADTDGGSVNDGVEVQRGTNPLDADDDVPKVEAQVKLEEPKAEVPLQLDEILFKSGSAKITPESEKKLEKVVSVLNVNREILIEIQGYTDSKGSLKMNQDISDRRAEAVKNWLKSHGIDGQRLRTKGFADKNPVAPNDSEKGRQKNRRVIFIKG
ncbi:MAG: OmpA family protein [Ignavibacteria bacterium]